MTHKQENVNLKNDMSSKSDLSSHSDSANFYGPTRLTRATLILFTAALTVIATRYLILPQMADTAKVRQQIQFDLGNQDSLNSHWNSFFNGQRQALSDLCRSDMPRLLPHLTLTSPQPGIIQIDGQFNSTSRPSGPAADITELVHRYCTGYLQQYQTLKQNPDQLPVDYSEKALRKWIKERQLEYNALQTQFISLLNHYSKLAVSLIGTEHRLEIGPRAIEQPGTDDEFELFAAGPVKEQLDNDSELISGKNQLDQLDAELMLLENKSYSSSSPTDLLDHDRRILEIKLKSNELRRQQTHRREILTRQTRQTLWDQYAITLRERSESLRKEISANTYQRELLQGTLNQSRKRIEFVQSFLPDRTEPNETVPAAKPAQPLDRSFMPPLAATQPSAQTNRQFSALQVAALLASIFLGAALGFLILLPFRHHHRDESHLDEIEINSPPQSAKQSSFTSGSAPSNQTFKSLAEPLSDKIDSNHFYDSISRQIVQKLHQTNPTAPAAVTLTAASDSFGSPRVAINTGIALTRQNIKTLLVELDHQHGLSSIIFPDQNTPLQGISDWLSGHTSDLPVYTSPLKGLLFTPSGQSENLPMAKNLAELKKIDKKELQCILIYCPSGFSNGYADLKNMTDFTIGMAPDDQSPPKNLQDLSNYLGTINWKQDQWVRPTHS